MTRRSLFKHYVLDAENRPVEASLMEWAMWLETIGNRCVAYTQITSEVTVSTVFIGIDHRFFGEGPPMLFETMVFGGALSENCWRYASWDDAEAGHAAAVRKAREAIGQRITSTPTTKARTPRGCFSES